MRKLACFFVFLVLLSFVACGGDKKSVSSATDENRTGTGTVTADEGGTVKLNNELTLSVPAGAVEQDTTITVERISECPQKFEDGLTPFGQVYRFTPKGTEFNLASPGILELNYNETLLNAANMDPKTIVLFYYDEENERYVAAETKVDTEKKKITAKIEHFTIYLPMAKALLPGNNPPQVTWLALVPGTIRAGAPVYVRATIIDPDANGAIATARLYYRKRYPTVDAWHILPLKREIRPNTFDTYTAIIPATYMDASSLGAGSDLQVYIEAYDNMGALTTTAIRGYSTTRTYNAGSITMTPATQTISAGFESLFIVRGVDNLGTTFQFIPDSFFVTNSIGTLKNYGTQGVYFKAQKVGSGTLTATAGADSVSSTITVKNGEVASVTVLDTNGLPFTGTLNMRSGDTYDFDTVGYDEYGNTILVNPVWTVDAAIGTVDQNGRLTAAIGPADGMVTATLGDLTDTHQIRVQSPLKDILTFSINGDFGTISAPFITLTEYGTPDLSNVVADFTTNGVDVLVNGVSQVSGVTANDFRNPVVYTVFAEDGTSQDYTVTVSVGVTGVTLDKSSITFYRGDTEQLTAIISPPNATNMTVTWASDNTAVATVSPGGLVTAVAPGTANITVTTQDGGRIESCGVTVVNDSVVTISAIPGVIAPVEGATPITTAIDTAQYTGTITWTPADNPFVVSTVYTANIVLTAKTGWTLTGVVANFFTVAGATATNVVNSGNVSAVFPETKMTFESADTLGDVVNVTAGSAYFNMIYANNSSTNITFPTGTNDATTGTISAKFFMGETEVTYELWRTVYAWATDPARGANIYSFANQGREGNDGTIGAAATNQEPVTTINWRDSMVWCNALTEYYNTNNGTAPDIDCVYYSNPTYTTPIRTSTDSATVTNTTAGSQDLPYIKAATNSNTDMANCIAKGFRLPTNMEWEYTARWRNDSTNIVSGYTNPYFTQGDSASGATTYYNDVTGAPNYAGKLANDLVAVYYQYWNGSTWILTGVTGTAAVKSKVTGANALGIYDMSGNVFEWCFEYSRTSLRVLRGGCWLDPANFLPIGWWGNHYADFEGNFVGFRFARTK